MKLRYLLPASACFIIGIAACTHKMDVTPATPGNGKDTTLNNGNNNNTIDTGVCFQRDILPIFISNCAKGGCHDAASKTEGFQFTDYNSIISKEFVPGNAEKTELYEKITEDKADKRMPPRPNPALTDRQIYLIRRWINEGAKNTTDCGTACDSNNSSYSLGIKPMIDQYCKGCHNNATLSGGYSFETHAGLKAAATNGRLSGAIKQQAGFSAMPKGGNKLSDCQIKQFEKWIAAGAPQN